MPAVDKTRFFHTTTENKSYNSFTQNDFESPTQISDDFETAELGKYCAKLRLYCAKLIEYKLDQRASDDFISQLNNNSSFRQILTNMVTRWPRMLRLYYAL